MSIRVTWVVGVLLALLASACAVVLLIDHHARNHPQDLTRLPQHDVRVRDKTLKVWVARETDEIGSGLSGQPTLGKDTALLLRSPDGDTRVTMLGMRFPLDVIWLDANGRVVGLRRAAAASPWPLFYSGPKDAVAVLEVPAGSADAFGISQGSTIAGLNERSL